MKHIIFSAIWYHIWSAIRKLYVYLSATQVNEPTVQTVVLVGNPNIANDTVHPVPSTNDDYDRPKDSVC